MRIGAYHGTSKKNKTEKKYQPGDHYSTAAVKMSLDLRVSDPKSTKRKN